MGKRSANWNILKQKKIQLWIVRAKVIRSHCIPPSNDILIFPLSPSSLVSQERYSAPSIKGIESVVDSLTQHSFDLDEWKSTTTTSGSIDWVVAVLKANTMLLSTVKQELSIITSSSKRLAKDNHFQLLAYSIILSRSPSFNPEDKGVKADDTMQVMSGQSKGR